MRKPAIDRPLFCLLPEDDDGRRLKERSTERLKRRPCSLRLSGRAQRVRAGLEQRATAAPLCRRQSHRGLAHHFGPSHRRVVVVVDWSSPKAEKTTGGGGGRCSAESGLKRDRKRRSGGRRRRRRGDGASGGERDGNGMVLVSVQGGSGR